MPELPEVECLTRAVRDLIRLKRCEKATFFNYKLRRPIPVDEINRHIVGQTITEVKRRAKYILVTTTNDTLVIHLGMTGNLIAYDTPNPILKHTHAILKFSDGKKGLPIYLHYIDPRRFGLFHYLPNKDLYKEPLFANLGPEPLEMRNLSNHLWYNSRSIHKPIKNFIMDNKFLVGVGNIYANESLYKARIHPATPSQQLTKEQFKNLSNQIKATLRKAIQKGGTTIKDFRTTDGSPGYFSIELNVYGKSGEPCDRCHTIIKTIRQAGRSTFFCPLCQGNPH